MITFPYLNEFSENLEILSILKIFYDSGNIKYINNSKNSIIDYDYVFEELFFNGLQHAAEFMCNSYLEEYETEKFFFSSSDMTEYYRLAYKLGKIHGMRENENRYVREAYSYLCSEFSFDYGIGTTIHTGTKHRFASSITVYLYNDFSWYLGLMRAVLNAFNYFKEKVPVLCKEYEELTLKEIKGAA